jgi:hypothetical protein
LLHLRLGMLLELWLGLLLNGRLLELLLDRRLTLELRLDRLLHGRRARLLLDRRWMWRFRRRAVRLVRTGRTGWPRRRRNRAAKCHYQQSGEPTAWPQRSRCGSPRHPDH